jgi:hypothetical protein
MNATLMHGLNEKDMQAVVNTYNLKNLYYPTLFPIGAESPMLTWKMLEGQAGLRIAADLVARGATIPRKVREAISRLQGDIPKIAVSRDKHEDELTEYDILVSMASNNPDQRALVEFWAEDTKFCFEGVANRLEWIALRQISLGKVTINNANNAAIVNEYNVDYAIPAAQKIGVNTTWATGTAGKPLTKDIPAALAVGKAIGATYKYMFMNSATLAKFVSQTEVINACASAIINAVSMQQEPDLAMANAMLAKRVKLKGLQIVEIDQDITVELADGSRTTANPFEDDVVMFSESKVLGRTFWKQPADMKLQASKALKVMNGHTCIKKYSEEEPLKEVTMGIANAFPAWNLSGRSVLMQINGSTWTK